MGVLYEKMGLMLILLILGYVSVYFRIVSEDFNKSLSRLIINVLLPGLILSSVINKELEMSVGDVFYGILLFAIGIGLSLGLGVICAKLLPPLKKGDSAMYAMLVGFMNNGFVGFPLVAALYGEEHVFFASLSNIPFNLMLYTLGIILLNQGKGETKLDLKRVISAPILSSVAALIIFILQIPMPAVIDTACDNLSAACIPLSMMCIGMTLGHVPVRHAFMQPKLYIVTFIKLIAAPVLIWAVLRLMVSDLETLGIIVLTVGVTPSAAMCTMLGIENGRDGIESSSGIFVTTILSLLTIPVMMSLLGLS